MLPSDSQSFEKNALSQEPVLKNGRPIETDRNSMQRYKQILYSGFYLARPESSPSTLASLQYDWVNQDWGVIRFDKDSIHKLSPIFQKYGMKAPGSLQIGFHYLSDGAVTPEEEAAAVELDEVPFSEPTADEVVIRIDNTKIRLTLQIDQDPETSIMRSGDSLTTQKGSSAAALGSSALSQDKVYSTAIMGKGINAAKAILLMDETKASGSEIDMIEELFKYLENHSDNDGLYSAPFASTSSISDSAPAFFNW